MIIDPLFGSIKEKFIDLLTPWIDAALCMITTPFTFDWITSLTTVFQGVAIAVVLIIVTAKGITSGILLHGGSEDESVGHYLYQSFLPIALIAATPFLTSAIIQATTSFVRIVNHSSSEQLASSIIDRLNNSLGDVSVLITGIIFIVTLYYICTISFQCIKRWIQLMILSVLTPLVCIFTATEDSSDYVTILKSMASVGVITALQVLLLASAPAMPELGASIAQASHIAALEAVLAPAGSAFLTIGLLAAIKQVPNWIEKYTYASTVAGRGGIGHHVSSTVRAASSVVRAVRG